MKKGIKLACKILSVFLAVLLVIQIAPMQIIADAYHEATIDENTENTLGVNLDDIDTTESEAEILAEETSKREQYVKHFRMSDGSYRATQYEVPVHFMQDGEWTDYDNTLVEVDANTEDGESASNKDLTNTLADYSVRLSKKINGKKFVRIEKDGYKLSWYYTKANKVTAQITEITDDGDETTLEKLSSQVVYKNVYKDTDFEYIIGSEGLKENIILNSDNTQTEFIAEYKANGLTPVQVNDKTIELQAEDGTVVYTINAPYMTDANMEYSDGITLTLSNIKNNKFTVTTTLDEDWLNDNDRVYPVIVDPVIKTEQKVVEMDSAFVGSLYPNRCYATYSTDDSGSLYVGKISGYGQTESYLKVSSLPTLSVADIVVDAKASVFLYSCDNGLELDIKRVTESWERNTITWNNKPSVESSIIDYTILEDGDERVWLYFGITDLVRGWYSGEYANYGVSITTPKTTAAKAWMLNHLFNEGNVTQVRPILYVTYRNNKGLEDYWTYTSADMGIAGAVSINDYSGNLVYSIPVASTAGLKLPVEVSLVYNSYMAGTTFKNAKSFVGKGWKLNIQQTFLNSSYYGLTGESNEMFKYVYTDADGTEHYFYKKTENDVTTYIDEDGLGLELSIGSSTSEKYIITNKDKQKWSFNSSGYITSISDASGNKAVITYNSSNQIEKITDANGKEVNFEISSNGYVNKITSPDGRTTSLEYNTNSMLTGVTFDYGKGEEPLCCTYEYSNGLLIYGNSFNGSRIKFMYQTDSPSKGAREIQMFGTDGTIGQKIRFNRSEYNTTVKQISVDDSTFNNSDDILVTMQFDNYGRTVSVQSKAYDGTEELGAQNYRYTTGEVNSTGSNIKKLNKISTAYSLGSNTTNLLVNHNLESTSTWYSMQYGGNATFSVSEATNQKLYGNKSLKINTTAHDGDSVGRVYQYIDAMYVKADTEYTLSAYVKTVGISGNYGACVFAQQDNATTSDVTTFSDYITGTTDTNVDNGWRRISVTFKTTGDISRIALSFGIRGAKGTAYFDGVQLEESRTPSSYNMLENSSFEKTSNNIPTNWDNYYLTDTDYAVKTEKQRHNTSYKIVGVPTETKEIFQDVPINGTENDTYIVSAWAKCDATPLKDNSSNRVDIGVKITYSDGTAKIKNVGGFNHNVEGWQFASVAVNLSDETSAEKTPVEIRVLLRYFRQANTIYFDNVQLIKEPVPTYVYDDDGNLTSVVSNAEQKSTMEYSDGNLTSYLQPNGSEYTYTYVDGTKLVDTATNQQGIVYNYDYDSYGNATSLTASKDNINIQSSTQYNYSIKNSSTYSVVVKDQDNYSVTSVYDANSGALQSVTDSLSGTTNYTYNGYNQLTNVSNSLIDNQTSYVYDSNLQLSGINHNGMQYSFAYDEYGNTTQIKIGEQILSTYNYKSYDRGLSSFTYGNGTTVGYTYDRYGNISERSYNGVVKYKWITDKSGVVSEHEDIDNKIKYNIKYDSLGRTAQYYASTTDSTVINKRLYTLEYGYDLNNNVTRIANSTKTGSNTVGYAYGLDDMPSAVTFDNGKQLSYSYDALGRLSTSRINTTAPIVNSYTFWESSRTTSSKAYTTTRIKEETVGNTTYKYVYDGVGNITEVSKKSGETYQQLYVYEYDSLCQLVSYTDVINQREYEYEYDNGGNIVEINVYSCSENEGKTLLDTVTYGYTDENWSDKLTNYNGTTITYDAIGNPLTYRDGMVMTWEKGRRLGTLTKGDTSISYTYDADGIRLSKTVNGVENKYQYVGGKLLQETRGDAIIDYSYDANGSISTFRYKANSSDAGAYYYYARNWMGDIVGIYNSTGTLIARYNYDVWGKLTSVTDADGTIITDESHIAHINPFRYRSYYYDNETGLYYLNSRYYDPVVGRFVNADKQINPDMVGGNLFAYCNNNPVNGCDPCGTCFHRWDFWNDCDKCGGETFKEKWNNFTNRISSVYSAQQETDRRIHETQIQIIRETTRKGFEVYSHGVELETEAQIQKHKTVIKVGEYFADNPLIAIDAATATIGVSTTLICLVGVTSIPVAGQVALGTVGLVCGAWGVYRVVSGVAVDLFEEETEDENK